jgi:hypothetical protein
MKPVRQWLEEADPLRSEPALGEDDAQRMRERVLDAANGAVQPSFARSPRAWYVGGLVAAAAVVALIVDWPRGETPPAGPPAPQADVVTASSVRQVHFVTANGTRVIWIFNREIEEKR